MSAFHKIIIIFLVSFYETKQNTSLYLFTLIAVLFFLFFINKHRSTVQTLINKQKTFGYKIRDSNNFLHVT